MKRIALVLALVIFALPVRAVGAEEGSGQFVLRCLYSHSRMDDPIVAPGQPGASHLHDFFGNTSVDAFSTPETMLGADTTCRVPSDTAGYWTPTAFLNGVQVTPSVMRIYYIGPAHGEVETIPAGLQMVGGNRDATSPADNPHVGWNCGQTKDVNTPTSDAPYDCTSWAKYYPFVDGVIAVIDFPSCWDGAGLRPEDVVYPVAGECPSAFPHALPRLSERVHLGVMNPLNPDTTPALTLSSGATFTLHADFWNTWQQTRLDQLVTDCVAARIHCGSVDATSTVAWSRQFGTTRYDLANAAAPDGAGGWYVAGFTNLSLEGQTYHGRSDAFVRRYDAAGTQLWTTEFGTSGTDQALAITVLGPEVYVAGSTDGRFPQQEARGGLDAFVARFNPQGTRLWLEQFGTAKDDTAAAVDAAPSDPAPSEVFLGGTTQGNLVPGALDGPSDAFVMQMDQTGSVRWTRQFGGAGQDEVHTLDVRDTTVAVGGSTEGVRGQPADLDGLVATLGVGGSMQWARDLGGPGVDSVTSLVLRAQGIYVAGWTDGSFMEQTALGGLDAFVGKLALDRSVVWTRQFGTTADDDDAAIFAVGKGVYVAGSTLGALPEGTLLGETDVFLRKYLPNGTEVWTRQLGTTDYDRAYAMAGDHRGVAIAGTTHGAFEGQINAGDRDAFVVRVAFA